MKYITGKLIVAMSIQIHMCIQFVKVEIEYPLKTYNFLVAILTEHLL